MVEYGVTACTDIVLETSDVVLTVVVISILGFEKITGAIYKNLS